MSTLSPYAQSAPLEHRHLMTHVVPEVLQARLLIGSAPSSGGVNRAREFLSNGLRFTRRSLAGGIIE